MKYKNGVPFEVKAGNATATVILENFSPAIVEAFNKNLVDEAFQRAEKEELQRALMRKRALRLNASSSTIIRLGRLWVTGAI